MFAQKDGRQIALSRRDLVALGIIDATDCIRSIDEGDVAFSTALSFNLSTARDPHPASPGRTLW